MWRFKQTPKGFRENDSHHKQFFDRLGTQLEYKEMDDWYNVSQDDIYQHGKGLLHRHYRNSPSQALQTVYPEHDWMMWRFGRTPKGFWENDSHHKQFFDRLGTQLGYKEMDDWYNVSQDDIYQHGKGLLCHHYNRSPSQALQMVYPEHDWMMWRFVHTPKGYWEKLQTLPGEQKRVVNWLSGKLSIREPSDWYRISKTDVRKHGVYIRYIRWILFRLCRSSKIFVAMLMRVYPEHNWDGDKLLRLSVGPARSSQRILFEAVKEILPNEGTDHVFCISHFTDVKEDFKHPNLLHPSGRAMELDVFVRRLHLAFEYQVSESSQSVTYV